jgi:hypothetical protein
MKKNYRFADIDLQIDIPDPQMYENDRSLAPFRAEAAQKAEVFQFEMVPALLPPTGKFLATNGALRVYDDGTRYIGSVEQTWDNAYAQVLQEGHHHRVLLKESNFSGQIGTHTVLNVIGAEHLIAQNGGFVFHSSYIAVGGKAILFTAPSGTGKSTQAALWEKHRSAEIINGDRSAVRLVDGEVCASGIPFAGSSNICKNVTLPLGAIVYLKQAPQNQIRRLRGAEAFRRVWEGCSVNTWDRADVAAVSETVQQVVCAVPVFELACTADEQAVKTLEETLRQEGIL